VGKSTWDDLQQTIDAAPYPVNVLPADPDSAARCLLTLKITTQSWLGAVVANSGGILVDHGWLRVLGSGHDGLPDVTAALVPGSGWLPVAYDVLGGQFAWGHAHASDQPTIHYFAPDDLSWQDLELGYADWLHAKLAGAANQFYDTLRWPGWQADVAALRLDQGIFTFPPPWTVEGKDHSQVSRKPVPLAGLISLHDDTARQLRGLNDQAGSPGHPEHNGQ
jgi:hypothetical protein